MPKIDAIALKAVEAVGGDRQDSYGGPEDNLNLVASFWNDYLDNKCTTDLGRLEITSTDVCNLMILLKIARAATGKFHEDNFVDICGYATIVGVLEDA